MAVTTAPDAPVGAAPAPRRRRRRVTLARVLGAVGRTFITAGVVILLFVVYQLWGTGVITARTQDDLRSQFEDLLAEAAAAPTTTAPPTTAPPTTAPPAEGATTTAAPATTTTAAPAAPAVAPAMAAPAKGSPVARIEIPSIGVDWIVVEGVDLGVLAKGPGHYPGTAMPGNAGNAAIAGHRTTYGAPFYRVNELGPGDDIVVTTAQGRFTYEVSYTSIVAPTSWDVVAPTSGAAITLTSCNPRYSARERIVVRGVLRGAPAAAPAPPPEDEVAEGEEATGEALPGDGAPTVDATGETAAGANHLVTQVYLDDDGGDPDAVRPSVLLALACLAVALAFWVLGRLWRRWPAYLLGTPATLAVLFVFFTQFSRLLPASY